jgi:hypothetical protein
MCERRRRRYRLGCREDPTLVAEPCTLSCLTPLCWRVDDQAGEGPRLERDFPSATVLGEGFPPRVNSTLRQELPQLTALGKFRFHLWGYGLPTPERG